MLIASCQLADCGHTTTQPDNTQPKPDNTQQQAQKNNRLKNNLFYILY